MNGMAMAQRVARRTILPALLALGMGTFAHTVFTQENISCVSLTGETVTELCLVSGRIATDTTFTAERFWLLRGAVFVDAPARLTIEAGTYIFGEFATNGTLIISRGAQTVSYTHLTLPTILRV